MRYCKPFSRIICTLLRPLRWLGHLDTWTLGQRDTWTPRHLDTETLGHRDTGPPGHLVTGHCKPGHLDTETLEHPGTGTLGHQDNGTLGNWDRGTLRHWEGLWCPPTATVFKYIKEAPIYSTIYKNGYYLISLLFYNEFSIKFFIGINFWNFY